MKKLPQALEDKLLEYIDGTMAVAERESFETMLRQDTDLAARLEELRAVNKMMRLVKPEQPSTNFTARVMQNLYRQPVTGKLSIRNGLFLLIGVLITIGIATYLVSTGAFDNASTVVDLNQMTIPNKYVNKTLPAVPFDGKMMVNVIVVLNLALLFVVLDRVILKPYFRRRMEASH